MLHSSPSWLQGYRYVSVSSFLARIMCWMVLVAVLSIGFSGVADAREKKKTKAAKATSVPYSPKNASIVIEANSGMVLSQDNADWTLYPASLTKMMTLTLVFDALDAGKITLRSPIVVSSKAASMAPSRLGVKAGQSITVDQGIRALVTKSANDISVAFAENLAGSEQNFALRMNLKAREIGMSRTHFVNASGLHNVQQYSSARDMAKLGQYLFKSKSRYYGYFSLKEFTYGGRVNQNHNHLMKAYDGMDGIKTGYVNASGFNLAASAKRNNVRLIGVVFGGKTASSRNAQMRELLDKGFERMRSYRSETGNMPILAPEPVKAVPPVAQVTRKATPTNQAETAVPLTAPTPQVAPIVDTTPMPVSNGAMGNWAVQLGAYQDRVSTDQAIYRALQKLPSPLNKGSAVVMPLRTADATWVFRARIGGYTKTQAEMVCRKIEHCLVISPTAH